MRDSAHQRILEFISGLETQITTINVVSKCESKFTMVEILRFDFFVVNGLQSLMIPLLHFTIAQPFEEKVSWENLIIKDFESITIKIELS